MQLDASLTVNGTEHLGWTEVAVTRSMEQLAHTFDVGFTERWADDRRAIPIREGDKCILKLAGKQVSVGYVDDAGIDYDGNDHTMHVSGRSLTGDLLDCSAIYKKGQWKKQKLDAIARNLCDPFEITVKVDTDLGDPFPTFKIEDSESVFEALERGCRQRGVVMSTSTTGELVFSSIGTKTTSTMIELGRNALKGARAGSWKDRFSKYVLKGQAPADDDTNVFAVAAPTFTTEDGVIGRYRPIVIMAEAAATSAGLKKRADWERNTRAGRSQRLKYTLDGWENAEGLWTPNTIAHVHDDFLQVDTKLLIISVRQTKSAEGSFTELELSDPKAMTVEPLTKQPSGKSKYLDYLKGGE